MDTRFKFSVTTILLILFALLASKSNLALAQANQHTRTAMNNAMYNHALLSVTPMLFHRIELSMRYDVVLNTIGKSAMYCDSGENHCPIENGSISKYCIDHAFIQSHQTWMCHWQGTPSPSYLQIWFVGDHVAQVTAHTKDGMLYTRNPDNTIHLKKM